MDLHRGDMPRDRLLCNRCGYELVGRPSKEVATAYDLACVGCGRPAMRKHADGRMEKVTVPPKPVPVNAATSEAVAPKPRNPQCRVCHTHLMKTVHGPACPHCGCRYPDAKFPAEPEVKPSSSAAAVADESEPEPPHAEEAATKKPRTKRR